MSSNNRKLYLDVICNQLGPIKEKMLVEGCNIGLRRLQQLLADLLNYETEDAELAGLERYIAYYASLVNNSIRLELMNYFVIRHIDDNKIIDSSIKKNLKVVFKSLDFDDITFHNIILDSKKILDRAPVISELPPDALESLLQDIRKSHSELLFSKYANRVNTFIENLSIKLGAYDLNDAYNFIHKELLQLNLEQNIFSNNGL